MLHFAASAKSINSVHEEASNFQCEQKEMSLQDINPRRQSIAHAFMSINSGSAQTVRANPA